MNIADGRRYQRHRQNRLEIGEILLVMLVFASMGAITWAIRGTSGWSGIDGTIVPGMTWGVLWWFICWRRGIDARGVPLWLGWGIAIGGELGYGQYVSWIRGTFYAGDEITPVAPWVGYAWFAICGVGWGGPGGIALGWALAGSASLGRWLARLVVPLGVALLARLAAQTWPWLFFPNWDLDVYVTHAEGAVDPAAAALTQRNMIIAWLAGGLASLLAWRTVNISRPISRWAALSAVAAGIALMLLVAQWLFFPEDQLGLLAGELGNHLGRTVYTNSQNAIVVGWWIGAMWVAAIQRDRYTLFAGSVLGIGFGIGFPLAAIWCLGYVYAPNLIDWWKVWELQAGFYLGLLYVAVLYWAIQQIDEKRAADRYEGASVFRQRCETISMSGGAFLAVYVMAREEFLVIGILLGLFYVVPMFQAMVRSDDMTDRRRGISFVYSAFLLVFIMAWGASSQTGIMLGLYDAEAVDQYAWPTARLAIFFPIGVLIVGFASLTMWRVLRRPNATLPSSSAAPQLGNRIVDLMTFTGVVGATSIWPSKIGALYALFLGLALFAFNRLNARFDRIDKFCTSPDDRLR